MSTASLPPPSASLSPVRGWLKRWSGALVSGLCLVHCLGMGLLAPFLPAAVSALALSPKMEGALWAVSMGVALLILRWPRPRAPLPFWLGWLGVAALGLWGLWAASERLTQASLASVAALQIWVTLRRLRTGHGHKATCAHDHGPRHAHGHGEAHGHGHAHAAGAHAHDHGLHVHGLDPLEVRESRTMAVVLLATVTMLGELLVGAWTGSLALVADGWHMATHVGALTLAWAAYGVTRKLAGSRHFAFGADKILALTGYTNALGLAVVAVFMLGEAWDRFVNPVPIRFMEAMPAAVVGLVVNLASARLLHPGELDHGHDHNLRAAYMHVLADALTSVLAVAALLGGRYAGLVWLDQLSAAVGAVVILLWAYGLVRAAGRELLDVHAEPALNDEIRAALEAVPGVAVEDLRVWPLGRGRRACNVTVIAAGQGDPLPLRARVEAVCPFDHLVVEVRPPRERQEARAPAVVA
ncbi:MAG: cation diffusion facilitator family transporter [Myxococcales bacterium]|nr:cation diffusion facilitator family transporter [Myxococcales bacterium]